MYQYGKQKVARVVATVAGDATAPSVVTETHTNQLGQQVRSFVDGTLTKTCTYDRMGNKLSQTDALGNVLCWCYDHAGRQISASRLVAGKEQASHTRYDELGRKLAEWDWMAQQTSYQYDMAGRLLKKTAPFDHREAVTLHYYDPAGQMLRQRVATEGGYIETAYSYDARGRQTAVTRYEDEAKQKWHRSQMAYDAMGNLLETRQGENHQNSLVTVTRTSYNRFGKPITVTDALGQAESYRYGPTGLLLEKTDRNGSVTSFRYDVLDRLIGKSVTVNGRTDSEETAYTRTGAVARQIGRATGQEPLEIAYSYDASGRLVKQTDPGRVSKEYSYDACGRKTRFLLYREGILEIDLSYVYDEVGRLTEVKRAGEVLARYGYDENGRRTRVSYPAAGLETQTAYNPGGLPTQMRYLKNGLVGEYVTYEYSPCGNRVGKTEDGRAVSYVYDRLGRLTEETGQSALDGDFRQSTVYSYDAWHNRQTATVREQGHPDVVTQYEYDKNNRLLKETVVCGKKTETYRYEYDKNGNQRYREWSATEPKCSGKGYGYIGFARELEGPVAIDERRYDGFGRLLEVYRDGMRAEYRTRPDGLRHQKNLRTPRGAETATLHCWDGQSIVLDARAEGDSQVVKTRYFRGSGLLAQQLDGKLYYYQHNAHGDVTRRVCEDGNAAPKYQYDAFGNQRTDDATDPNPFRYCGEYYDKELGEVYLRARQYDPRTGRFTSEDPAKDGGNWYGYCAGNPVRYCDSLGLYYEVQNSDGTYYLLHESMATVIWRALIDQIPIIGGTLADHTYTSLHSGGIPDGRQIVGGTSTSPNWGIGADDVLTSIIPEQLAGLTALVDVGIRFEVYNEDTVVFALMDILGLSTEFNSLDDLRSQMNNIFSVMSTGSDYFYSRNGAISATTSFSQYYKWSQMDGKFRNQQMMQSVGFSLADSIWDYDALLQTSQFQQAMNSYNRTEMDLALSYTQTVVQSNSSSQFGAASKTAHNALINSYKNNPATNPGSMYIGCRPPSSSELRKAANRKKTARRK